MVSGTTNEIPYFWNLSSEESSVLNRMRDALAHHKNSVNIIKKMDIQRIQGLVTQLLDNDPTQIGVNGFQFVVTPLVINVQPMYLLSKERQQALLSECDLHRDKILRRITAGDVYDAVLQAHDILSRNIRYVAGENPELHSIVGPLTKKAGVCEGYAKTLKHLLDSLSIPSIVVMGNGYNRLTQQEEPHAWNLVQIDGEWTHIDLTFNTTIREHNVLRYDYFGLCDEDILKDHKFDVSLYPEASSRTLSYYEKNKAVMRKKSCLNAYLQNSFQNGEKDIVFKLPDTASEANIEVQVTSEINAFLSQNHLYTGYMLYYNAKQKVFHIHLENLTR